VSGLFAGVFLTLGPTGLKDWATGRAAPGLNMRAIEAALRKSLEEKPLSSPTLKAAEIIAPSVVRVVGLMSDDDDGKDQDEPLVATGRDPKKQKIERGVGTGVVIIDNGTILTNLHVLQGAKRIKVTFADGHVSDANLISADPKNDLAVLRARSVPDDLQAAAMRSTGDLAPGEPVVAVGYPFGIGPSTSAGVVSGLKREFRSPDGQQVMTNLIQFDAAANPGNSGGPLVTLDGAVVGIVTAILNPSQQRVFIGIGFAVPIENAAGAAGMPPF
jgi:S1-C subfamily serine protease